MEQKIVSIIECDNEKTAPYGSKGVLRHYHYRSHLKLGQGAVSVRRIPCGCQACTTQLSLPWNSKIKDACNQAKYERVYD